MQELQVTSDRLAIDPTVFGQFANGHSKSTRTQSVKNHPLTDYLEIIVVALFESPASCRHSADVDGRGRRGLDAKFFNLDMKRP